MLTSVFRVLILLSPQDHRGRPISWHVIHKHGLGPQDRNPGFRAAKWRPVGPDPHTVVSVGWVIKIPLPPEAQERCPRVS
jgi:hypothetical protein